jgi:hypothetical protein
MAQFARRNRIDQLLIAVHPRHARFYQRMMGFEVLGPIREYPSVCNRPAVAYCLDFARVDRIRPACYTQIFGSPVPEEKMIPRPMPAEERTYYLPATKAATYWIPAAAG